jgi:hypothetical protein
MAASWAMLSVLILLTVGSAADDRFVRRRRLGNTGGSGFGGKQGDRDKMLDFGDNAALRSENARLQKELKKLNHKLGGENFELRKLIEVLRSKLKSCRRFSSSTFAPKGAKAAVAGEADNLSKWERKWEEVYKDDTMAAAMRKLSCSHCENSISSSSGDIPRADLPVAYGGRAQKKNLQWYTRRVTVQNGERLPFLGEKFGPLVDDKKMSKGHDNMVMMGASPAIADGDFGTCETVDFLFVPKRKSSSRCMVSNNSHAHSWCPPDVW